MQSLGMGEFVIAKHLGELNQLLSFRRRTTLFGSCVCKESNTLEHHQILINAGVKFHLGVVMPSSVFVAKRLDLESPVADFIDQSLGVPAVAAGCALAHASCSGFTRRGRKQ